MPNIPHDHTDTYVPGKAYVNAPHYLPPPGNYTPIDDAPHQGEYFATIGDDKHATVMPEPEKVPPPPLPVYVVNDNPKFITKLYISSYTLAVGVPVQVLAARRESRKVTVLGEGYYATNREGLDQLGTSMHLPSNVPLETSSTEELWATAVQGAPTVVVSIRVEVEREL